MRENKPSATACLIAASLGICARDPATNGLVDPLAVKASAWFMDAYGRPADLFTRSLGSRWAYSTARLLERMTIPGIFLHYILRKRYLEGIALRALQEGVRQLVVLGGGFDILALKLHDQYPDIRFIEVDYPATQHIKRNAIGSHRSIHQNLSFIPIDFSKQTLEEGLMKNVAYNPKEKSLFIAEGVLMYLTQKDVDGVFSFIRRHSGPGSQFAFTFMDPRADGRINFHHRSKIVDFWMRLRKEPFVWGIRRGEIANYLASVQFQLTKISSPAEFRERFLSDRRLSAATLAEGELVCLSKAMQS